MSQGTAVETHKVVEQAPSWINLVWAGGRQATIAIAVDVLIYCSLLLALLICFLALKLFQKIGYPQDRLALFEVVHFWAYWGLNLIFMLDLVVKSGLLLVTGWKNAKHNV